MGLHEPPSALDGGKGQGLDSLRPVCAAAQQLLMPGGFLVLEVGAALKPSGMLRGLCQGAATAVAMLLQWQGWWRTDIGSGDPFMPPL